MLLPIQGILLMLLITGVSVYWVLDAAIRFTYQVKYEGEFLERHENFIAQQQRLNNPARDAFIPLLYPHRENEHLSMLCTQYRSKLAPVYYINLMQVRNSPPIISTFRMRFRRVAPDLRPIRIQGVRCGSSYAVVDAGDNIYGLVLEKQDNNVINTNNPPTQDIFNIYAKFKYILPVTPPQTENIEMTPTTDPAVSSESMEIAPANPAVRLPTSQR